MNWNQIVNELGPPLLKYFCGSFDRTRARDAVQETLTRLVSHCEGGRYQPARGPISNYAFGLAHFVRLEMLREKQYVELSEDSLNSAGPAATGQHQSLRQAVDRLEEPQRQIVLLMLDQDMGYAEISRLLQIPVNTVKSHIHRAKLTLREFLISRGESHGK